MSPSDTPTPKPTSTPSRRRIGLRAALWVLALLPVLAGVSLWLVTRSWFIILMVAPELEQKLGGQVGIANAAYRGDGVLVFENLTLQTPSLVGPPAQVLHVAKAVIAVDTGSIFAGGIEIEDVELDGVLMRLSEDQRYPGVFNFSALTPDWSTGDLSGELLPPSVTIHNAVLELGQHIGQEYLVVGRRWVAGEMYPAPSGDGWYDFKLEELDENGVRLGDAGLYIDGRWNVETMEHRALIEGLTLDDRTFGMCPQMARLWWQRMQPEGPVGSARIEWQKGKPFVAELVVDHMALNIPIDATTFSATYQQGNVETATSLPRMYVDSGTIRLEGNQLTLDNLVGVFGSSQHRPELVEIGYQVNFSIHDMPAFDWKNPQAWMDNVVDTAPFEMSVRMNDFQLTQSASTPDGAPAVELPTQVADTLAKFQLTGWSLSTQVDITRAPPTITAVGQRIAAPIQTGGTAHITDATGAFMWFPYPLDNVTAAVKFDNERIDLVYLNATGSDDATVSMSGWIAPPGRDAAISLRLIAQNIPLDERFREGLRGGQREIYDIMLDEPAYAQLLAEGLIPNDSDVAAAGKARQELVAELSGLDPADERPDIERRRAHLQREIERLGTIEKAGEFKMGGLIDLDLTVERPRGTDPKPQITGSIEIHRAGVVYRRFPYPIHVRGGSLVVEQNRVRIVPGPNGAGIPIATPGGGRGTVMGEVTLMQTDQGPRVKPALAVDLRGDYLSELLYAAMPLTKDDVAHRAGQQEHPGRRRSFVARILAGAGITGWLNHTGVITATESGQPTFDFAVELFDARAEPNEELFETMQELGLPSPRGVALDGVHALLQITPQSVRLVDFTGQRGGARITADAQVDLAQDPIEAELNVEFENLALERYMVDLTPGAGRQRTAELWDRYQPQGIYDASLSYRGRGGTAEFANLQIWPKELGISVDGEPVWLICDRGEIVLHQKEVSFNDLLLKVTNGTREDGIIALDGSYGLATEQKDLRLEGRWSEGQLASPLITETLDLIGAEQHADRYRSYAPTGTFDAEFFYESPGGQRHRRYEFIVQPHTLGATVNETPIFAELDDGAELMFTPGRIIFRDLAGEHAGGRFRFDGAADVEDLIDIDVDVSYDGRIDSPQLLALLPAALRSTLVTLQIQAQHPVQLSQGRLLVTQIEPAGTGGEWDTSFTGLLQTNGASLKVAGVEFAHLDGVFDLEAAHNPVDGTSLEVRARADRAHANGRSLSNVEADIQLADGGRTVLIPAIRADTFGGVITGYAWAGLDEGSDYEAAIDLGGVSLEAFSKPADNGALNSRAGNGSERNSGRVFGSFRLAGRRGEPDSRRGRGALRVVEGRMVDMPVTLRLLQLFEIMPPLAGSLDFADVDFYVDGGRLVFERLFLECPTLWMIGEGEMSFPGLELDVRVRTKGTLPVVGDIVAAVSDTLFQVEVTGPIGDPKAKFVALPGVTGPSQGQKKARPPTAQASAE
ncbi:MAG: hypothetical protein ACYSW2_04160 [Planctomycetota bacterium]|jgi:hypothetical protein